MRKRENVKFMANYHEQGAPLFESRAVSPNGTIRFQPFLCVCVSLHVLSLATKH